MRAARAALALLPAISILASAAGCDWRDFDELKKNTPVLTVGPDKNFPVKGDYGRYVLPLSGPAPGATGGRYLVSAASTGCIGIVDVNGVGQASNRSVCSNVFGTTNPVFPITAMAEVPGTRDVLLGAPQAGGTGSVYVYTQNAKDDVRLLDSPATEDRFGLGVGAGALAGGAAPDYVVVSQFQLTVYLDGDSAMPVVAPIPPADCPLEIPTTLAMRSRLNRAVVVAPLEGPGAPQIVVGTPSTGSGAVSVFRVDPTTGEASCAFAYRSPEPRFGHALATGDFDGDGKTDLLVGAPPGKAYWIRGPLTMASPLLPVKLAGSGDSSAELGSSVGAANVDGQAGDEALVGDSDATVAGKDAAGEVHIVASTMPSGGMVLDKELPLLRRHDPGAADAFGAQARALPFCTAGCGTGGAKVQNLVLVGAQAVTYTYFLLLPGDKDPRKP